MKRNNGRMGIFLAAEILGITNPNNNRGDWSKAVEAIPEKYAWEGTSGYSLLFPKYTQKVTWSFDQWEYSQAAYFYAVSRVSLYGKPLFDLDKNKSPRWGAALTRRDAILVAVRLAESEKYPFIKGQPRYVQIEDIGTHHIDKALYTCKTTLPDATNQKLPMWRGFNLWDKCVSCDDIVHCRGSQRNKNHNHRTRRRYFGRNKNRNCKLQQR